MSKKKDSLKPWLSRPAINRSVTLPLTRPLTQRLSNLNEFHPNELDPYLLFDARDSMIGTLENPTLDLDPSKPDTLNVITATRAGTATFTDVNGNIATASADTVRVDYTQGAELTPTKFQRVPYSTPDSNWTTVNSTLVEDFGVAPDNTQSASKVTKLAVSGSGSSNDRVEYPSIAITNGTTYSVSVHLKNIDVAGFTTICARVSGGSLFRVKFIWNTSSVSSDSGTTSNRLVEDLGDGWYRVSFSFDANGAAVDFEIDVDRSTGGREDTSSILVWGAQLEEGTTASSFVANTTGSPKFITGATFGPRVPMILVEPSATNLVDYSEDIANNLWGKTGVSVTENAATAPDGTVIASKIQVDSSNSFHFVGKSIPLGAAYYSFSAYLKADTATTASFFLSQSGNNGAVFDLQAGSLISVSGTGNTASIEDVGNGWFRCVVTNNGSSDVADQVRIGVANGAISSFQGNETDSLYIWGAQLEAGSLATSYIPTSGGNAAARTRAADDLVITGSAFSDFYNQSEGTVYIELTSEDDGKNSYPVYFTQDIAGYTERNNGTWAIQKDALSNVYLASWANGGFVSNSLISLGGYTAGNLTRVSVSYDSNSYEGSKDGASVQTSTPTTMATTLVNRLFVGGSGAFQNSSHIKRLIYWPTHSDSL